MSEERLERYFSELEKQGYSQVEEYKVHEGRNNKVIRIKNKDGVYALKTFPETTDGKKRFIREQRFLNHCKKIKTRFAPELYGLGRQMDWILTEWINGPQPTKIKTDDIRRIVNFIAEINSSQKIQYMPYARESIISHKSIIRQLSARYIILTKKLETYEGTREFKNWIIREFIPATKERIKRFENQTHKSHWKNMDEDKVISPSDVGLHNSIQTSEGIRFIDFEYAGLDDMSKLTSDWIMQPNMPFSQEQKMYLISELKMKLPELSNDAWIKRQEDIESLIHCKWCYIIISQIFKGREPATRIEKKAMRYFKLHLA